MSEPVSSDESAPDEEPIRAAWEQQAHARAATLALELYGSEILAFLIARLRSSDHGEEVFSTFAEKLWRGLPGFEWRCSFKSWAYKLARNAANDYSTAVHNRMDRNRRLSDHPELQDAVERVRTRTEAYRRTEVKDRMQQLRETLEPDDQMLLILRVDRGMSWRDLAVALSEGDHALDAPAVERAAAKLRKRFERVKVRLRELAQAEGLL